MTLTLPDVHALARELEASVSAADAALYRPRYNAAPTDLHFIVRPSQEGRRLLPARWGFDARTGLLINARAESAGELSAFREAFQRSRVVVPADGFYEWKGPRGARRPVWFRPRGGGLLYLAGLEEIDPDGVPRFVVLTTAASGPVATLHDRMPALLPRERIADWLERPDTGLLVPRGELLASVEVSARVNDVRNDDASLLIPEPPGPEQLRLI